MLLALPSALATRIHEVSTERAGAVYVLTNGGSLLKLTPH
jgi:hypothetical protein